MIMKMIFKGRYTFEKVVDFSSSMIQAEGPFSTILPRYFSRLGPLGLGRLGLKAFGVDRNRFDVKVFINDVDLMISSSTIQAEGPCFTALFDITCVKRP